MTATQARKNFFDLIAAAGKPGFAVTITHDGLPKVVMMSFEEFEGWMETMDILSDPEEAAAVREAMEEMKKGNAKTTTWEEAKKEIGI